MLKFICGYLAKATRYIVETELAKDSMVYSEAMVDLCSRSSKRKRDFNTWMSLLKGGEKNEGPNGLFVQVHCESGLPTMKFYVLDYLCPNLGKCRRIQILDAAR